MEGTWGNRAEGDKQRKMVSFGFYFFIDFIVLIWEPNLAMLRVTLGSLGNHVVPRIKPGPPA